MSELLVNEAAVQKIAEAIASVLAVEVTIVDDQLRRIAGTGRYAMAVGEQLARDSAFARVLRDRQGFVISNPGEDSACITCVLKQSCNERAEVCCPIVLDQKAIGIIALIAFDDSQRRSLLLHPDRLLDFLDRMADLIANKVRDQERALQLNNMQRRIETIINTVQEGIVAVDQQGKIVNINSAAAGMLQVQTNAAPGTLLTEYLPGLPVGKLLTEEKDWHDREIFRVVNGRKNYYLVNTRLWREADEICGLVAILREMADVRRLVSNVSTQTHCFTFEMILGDSPALRKIKQEAAQAAAGSATVLIRGESGTGKELFARAIHCVGDRRDKPFVAINCAAIPEALLESELFGYEEGAFTGAKRGGKPGKFELADGGTVFLDEIGDVSLSMQTKLLRVLQERQIERVGGAGATPVDVRIIAATHKNLEAMVQTGEFRQDLFYRLNVFPLLIPPLRERTEDLPLLVDVFFQRVNQTLQKNLTGIDESVYSYLKQYSWPGNIRELENTLEYLVNIETSDRITINHIPERIQKSVENTKNAAIGTNVTPIAELERQAILGALQRFGLGAAGKEKAALALGISKATLYRKLKEYGKQD
jgi:transcriptional regulator with PAS, ATPase and Fis domain